MCIIQNNDTKHFNMKFKIYITKYINTYNTLHK